MKKLQLLILSAAMWSGAHSQKNYQHPIGLEDLDIWLKNDKEELPFFISNGAEKGDIKELPERMSDDPDNPYYVSKLQRSRHRTHDMAGSKYKGYIIGGVQSMRNGNDCDGFIAKCEDGKIAWYKEYAHEIDMRHCSDNGLKVIASADEGCLAVFHSVLETRNFIKVRKYSANGDLLWETILPMRDSRGGSYSSDYFVFPQRVVEDSNGNFVLVFKGKASDTYSDYSGTMEIIKLTAKGEVAWHLSERKGNLKLNEVGIIGDLHVIDNSYYLIFNFLSLWDSGKEITSRGTGSNPYGIRFNIAVVKLSAEGLVNSVVPIYSAEPIISLVSEREKDAIIIYGRRGDKGETKDLIWESRHVFDVDMPDEQEGATYNKRFVIELGKDFTLKHKEGVEAIKIGP